MCSVDVSEVGGGPLQSGDFVGLGMTKGHERVQLITVKTDPPSASDNSLSFTKMCVCVCVWVKELHTFICLPALPFH